MSRQTLIYGNCEVFSPKGKLMFRCLKKRGDWYLKRDLATVLTEDPLTIQLTFEPKGCGDGNENLKAVRHNKCVVCGDKELETLTKHHIVPYQYRKHFPDALKGRNSILVVPICVSCHARYEQDFAILLKKQLELDYDAPINGVQPVKSRIKKDLNAVLIYGDHMPEGRLKALQRSLLDSGVDTEGTPREELESYLKNLNTSNRSFAKPHGLIVVEKCKDLTEFTSMWVKDFVENMEPTSMPEYFNEKYTFNSK